MSKSIFLFCICCNTDLDETDDCPICLNSKCTSCGKKTSCEKRNCKINICDSCLQDKCKLCNSVNENNSVPYCPKCLQTSKGKNKLKIFFDPLKKNNFTDPKIRKKILLKKIYSTKKTKKNELLNLLSIHQLYDLGKIKKIKNRHSMSKLSLIHSISKYFTQEDLVENIKDMIE